MALVRRSRQTLDIWPGFVDALATLLMVIIFLLMIFVISQVYLNDALVGRDAALERLNRQLADMAEQLGLERAANEDMRANIDSLSSQLRASITRRDELQSAVGALQAERNAILSRLELAESERDGLSARLRDTQAKLDDASVRLSDAIGVLTQTRARLSETELRAEDAETALTRTEDALSESQAALVAETEAKDTAQAELDETRLLLTRSRADLEDAYATIDASEKTIAAQLAELDQLTNDVVALNALRDSLLEQVANLEAANRSLADDNVANSAEIEETQNTLRTTLTELDEQTEAALLARAEAARLANEVAALRDQIGQLNALLEESERRDAESQAQIADLGKRLNVALASKVQELARYRSEFFGRLREILGDRRDIQIVGDRFVFQSEVLFQQGSADLGEGGEEQLGQLADTLLSIASDIPTEINWVLRVDGHTDRIPIATARFPSNWELSTARAISVVKYLQGRGVPQERLAATGFAEFQPLDPRDDEIAFRRNRRIELKLTER